MNSMYVWPALAILGSVAVTIPVMENGSSRSILYWWVIPPVAVGLAAIFKHAGVF